MNTHDKGFIFISTLLMVSVISLLVLTSMHHVLIYFKAINAVEKQHQELYQLERQALKIAKMKSGSIDPHCMLMNGSANKVIRLLQENKGCSLAVGKNQYQYFVEDLKDDPCFIHEINRTMFSTHHRRVTIIQRDNATALLQIKYVSVIPNQICLGSMRTVPLGLSSWRYVIY